MSFISKDHNPIIRDLCHLTCSKRGTACGSTFSSSNFPRFDVNPNTGEPLGGHRSMTNAENTVYHDKLRASYIELSIRHSSEP